MTTALAPAPVENASNTRKIAHYYCILKADAGNCSALCGKVLQMHRAPKDAQDCVVCDELVHAHRAECPACLKKFGPA